MNVADRLAGRLVRVNNCLEFQGYRLRGYGRIGIGKQVVYAHRLAYALAQGVTLAEINGILVCHTCDNPPCCEPAHLFLGDHAINADDAVAKGRMGHPHWAANDPAAMQTHMRRMASAPRPRARKLSDEQLADIRRLRQAGASQKELAVRFGCAQSYISMVTAGHRRVGAG